MSSKDRKLRLGIIGCGAVTSQAYLPALEGSSLFSLEALVDINGTLVEELSKQYIVPHHFKDYHDCLDQIDAAIVALPHHLHAEVSIELLEHGIHVLCEKPMALEYSDCRRMLQAATSYVLSVSSLRRFYWSSRKVKQLIENAELGNLVSITWEEGHSYEWPTASGFYFNPKQSGGGVTTDTGYYIFDMLIWWIGQYPCKINYKDDNFGGVEAEAEVELQFDNGLSAKIKTSRLVPLRNTAELQFENGKITYFISDFDRILVSNRNSSKYIDSPQEKSSSSHFRDMIDDFGMAIVEKTPCFVNPKEVALATKLINDCYQNRKELHQSWTIEGTAPIIGNHSLDKRKIFLTGATGFVGGRIVERLALQYQQLPICLVRNPAHMARIARFQISPVFGDVMNPKRFANQVSDCDVFIHTVYGKESNQEKNWAINIEGTENLLKLAVENKAKHFIYISSTAVYEENFSTGCIDEDVVPICKNRDYAAAKLEVEKLCLEYSHKYDLPVTILRPSIIYGPFAPAWTIAPYTKIKDGSLRKYIDFNGVCNAVYVDDVVSAIIACICNESAYNETFNIVGEDKITWNEFFDFYSELALGQPLPEASISRLRVRYLFNSSSRKLAGWALNRMPDLTKSVYTSLHEKVGLIDYIANIAEFSPGQLRFFQKDIVYPTDKIQNRLRHRDRFPFAKGSLLTAQWLRNSNY